MFAFGCLAHLSLYFVNSIFLGTSNYNSFFPIAPTLPCLMEAGRGISALHVIHCEHDVLHAGVILRPLQITT